MYQLKSEIDNRMKGELYNSIKNSEISKLQRNLFKDNGINTFLPFVSSPSSMSIGDQVTTPENIFDSSSVTEASFNIIANENWKVLVVDYINGRTSFGNFNVSGDYYVGVLFGSVLTNGINVMDDSTFNSLNKSGLRSDGYIYKNNVQARLSYLMLNGGTISFLTSSNPNNNIRIGINSSKLRILSISGTPNKIFYAVKNGNMNFTKLPTSAGFFPGITPGSEIEIDSIDYSTGYGFTSTSYNYGSNIEFSLLNTFNSQSIQYFYGIAIGNALDYGTMPTPTLTVPPVMSNFISIGSSSRSINYGGIIGIANLVNDGLSNKVYFFNNNFTSNTGTVYRVFACGRSVNNFASVYRSSGTGTSFKPFVIATGTLLRFTVLNESGYGYSHGRIGENIFNEFVSGIAYDSRRFTLYKNYGLVTTHRFPRNLSTSGEDRYFFEVTLNDTSTSSLWCGILKENTALSIPVSNGTLPNPELYMKIDSGLVGTITDPDYFTYPNTNANSGIYTVYFGIRLSGTSSILEIGRNVLEASSISVSNMSHYSIVFWSNGGTSDTSQPMVTLHRLTTSSSYS